MRAHHFPPGTRTEKREDAREVLESDALEDLVPRRELQLHVLQVLAFGSARRIGEVDHSHVYAKDLKNIKKIK